MKWPFVSRAAFEGALNQMLHHRDRVDVLSAALERHRHDADARYDRLLDKYHDLMQRRANADKLPPAVTPPAPEIDLVMLEVANQAGRDHRLYAILAAYVQTERAKARKGDASALDDSQLLAKVRDWESDPNDGTPRSGSDGHAPEGFWPDEEREPVNAS